MSEQQYPREVQKTEEPAAPGGGGLGGGNGSLVSHRLTELERRAGILESDMKEVKSELTKISTGIDILKWSAGIIIVLISIVVHAVFRMGIGT